MIAVPFSKVPCGRLRLDGRYHLVMFKDIRRLIQDGQTALVRQQLGKRRPSDGKLRPDFAHWSLRRKSVMVQGQQQSRCRGNLGRRVNRNQSLNGPWAQLLALTPAVAMGNQFHAVPPDADRCTQLAPIPKISFEAIENLT